MDTQNNLHPLYGISRSSFLPNKIFNGTSANLEYIEIPMTAFKAYLSTEHGTNLTVPPFDKDQAKISDPLRYHYSQHLGADMREAKIEAFIYVCTR